MTGGFFRCTRYEVVDKVDEQHQSELTDASKTHKSLQELNRFVHYYTRYENHKHSLEVGIIAVQSTTALCVFTSLKHTFCTPIVIVGNFFLMFFVKFCCKINKHLSH